MVANANEMERERVEVRVSLYREEQVNIELVGRVCDLVFPGCAALLAITVACGMEVSDLEVKAWPGRAAP